MAELKYSAQGQRRREVNDANCGIAKIPNPIQFFSFFPHCCCYSCGFCRFLLTHLYLLFNIFFFIIISFRSALLLLVFVAYNATPARSCNYSDDRAVAADGLLTSTEVDADSDASVASKRNCVATEAVCACIYFFFVSPA